MTTKETATESNPRILVERYLGLVEEAERAQKALTLKDNEHRALLDEIYKVRKKLSDHVGRQARRRVFQFGNRAVIVRWIEAHPVAIDITTLE